MIWEKFRKGQYQKGYFDYKKDGFGPVCENQEELEKVIERVAESNLENEEMYRKREEMFFPLWDRNNCKRNYETIKEV